MEAWCLQYNQHLGKTLLLPVEEPKSILEHGTKEKILRKRLEIEEYVNAPAFFFIFSFNGILILFFRSSRRFSKRKTVTFNGGRSMVVVTCGASGHNIRSKPSLKAEPVGMLTLGNTVIIQEDVNVV